MEDFFPERQDEFTSERQKKECIEILLLLRLGILRFSWGVPRGGREEAGFLQLNVSSSREKKKKTLSTGGAERGRKRKGRTGVRRCKKSSSSSAFRQTSRPKMEAKKSGSLIDFEEASRSDHARRLGDSR